jgi:hypothetical protein
MNQILKSRTADISASQFSSPHQDYYPVVIALALYTGIMMPLTPLSRQGNGDTEIGFGRPSSSARQDLAAATARERELNFAFDDILKGKHTSSPSKPNNDRNHVKRAWPPHPSSHRSKRPRHDSYRSQAAPSNLDDQLDQILSTSSPSKHIDAPLAQFEDESSRLKTQNIVLATLVVHLQYRLEAEQRKNERLLQCQQSQSQPQPQLQRTPVSTKFKTADVQTPQPGNLPSLKSQPLSIIHPSKPGDTPKAPVTNKGAASPMSATKVSFSNSELTPTLERFLVEVRDAVEKKDAERIARDLQIEPPLAQAYADLQRELRKYHSRGYDQQLRTLSGQVLPQGPGHEGGRNLWEPFAAHLFQYLQYIRDFAPENLLKTNNDAKSLLKWVRRL